MAEPAFIKSKFTSEPLSKSAKYLRNKLVSYSKLIPYYLSSIKRLDRLPHTLMNKRCSQSIESCIKDEEDEHSCW